jgi:hypothetical protein
MKILKAIWIFLLWLLYGLFTMNARSRYNMGVTRGMHCYKVDNGVASHTFHYDPTRKPFREYSTWREFWTKHNWPFKQFPNFKKTLDQTEEYSFINHFFTKDEKSCLTKAIKHLKQKGYSEVDPTYSVFPGQFKLREAVGGTELVVYTKGD